MAFVVDNSIVVAWLIESQATPYTRRLSVRAKREALHAPGVWPLEFVNTLWAMQKRRLLRPGQADALVAKAARLAIVVDMEPVALPSMLGLVRNTMLSSYDASYLELATRRGLPLATRDASLARAARAAGVLLS